MKFLQAFFTHSIFLLHLLLVLSFSLTQSVSAHENNPITPKKYRLPFDLNHKAKVTNGPFEGNHGVNCCLISKEAVDFVFVASDTWNTVRAAKAGDVIYSAWPNNGGYGRTVVIQHQDGFFSYYEHLDGFSVTAPVHVNKGDAIGIIGQTDADAIHLHFEVRDQVQINPFNIGTGDSRKHSITRSSAQFKRIGWFPWYPNNTMNSGYLPRSTSHPMGVCLNIHNLVLQWPAPNEFIHTENNQDKFQGWSWSLDHDPAGLPPRTLIQGSANMNSTTYTDLADGTWWFHMRAYSNEYLWSEDYEVSHLGPFILGVQCKDSVSPSDWNSEPDLDP